MYIGECTYNILSSKRPWALETHGQKTGGALTRRWALTREKYGITITTCTSDLKVCLVLKAVLLLLGHEE